MQVVAHKGERFVYAKTKNATTEEDPKSFISLKIKKKGSGGPGSSTCTCRERSATGSRAFPTTCTRTSPSGPLG